MSSKKRAKLEAGEISSPPTLESGAVTQKVLAHSTQTKAYTPPEEFVGPLLPNQTGSNESWHSDFIPRHSQHTDLEAKPCFLADLCDDLLYTVAAFLDGASLLRLACAGRYFCCKFLMVPRAYFLWQKLIRQRAENINCLLGVQPPLKVSQAECYLSEPLFDFFGSKPSPFKGQCSPLQNISWTLSPTPDSTRVMRQAPLNNCERHFTSRKERDLEIPSHNGELGTRRFGHVVVEGLQSTRSRVSKTDSETRGSGADAILRQLEELYAPALASAEFPAAVVYHLDWQYDQDSFLFAQHGVQPQQPNLICDEWDYHAVCRHYQEQSESESGILTNDHPNVNNDHQVNGFNDNSSETQSQVMYQYQNRNQFDQNDKPQVLNTLNIPEEEPPEIVFATKLERGEHTRWLRPYQSLKIPAWLTQQMDQWKSTLLGHHKSLVVAVEELHDYILTASATEVNVWKERTLQLHHSLSFTGLLGGLRALNSSGHGSAHPFEQSAATQKGYQFVAHIGNTVRFFDVKESVVHNLFSLKAPIRSFDLSSYDGDIVAVAGAQIARYSIATGHLRDLFSFMDGATGATFSPIMTLPGAPDLCVLSHDGGFSICDFRAPHRNTQAGLTFNHAPHRATCMLADAWSFVYGTALGSLVSVDLRQPLAPAVVVPLAQVDVEKSDDFDSKTVRANSISDPVRALGRCPSNPNVLFGVGRWTSRIHVVGGRLNGDLRALPSIPSGMPVAVFKVLSSQRIITGGTTQVHCLEGVAQHKF